MSKSAQRGIQDAARLASGAALVLSQPLARLRLFESLSPSPSVLALPSSAAAAGSATAHAAFQAARDLILHTLGTPHHPSSSAQHSSTLSSSFLHQPASHTSGTPSHSSPSGPHSERKGVLRPTTHLSQDSSGEPHSTNAGSFHASSHSSSGASQASSPSQASSSASTSSHHASRAHDVSSVPQDHPRTPTPNSRTTYPTNHINSSSSSGSSRTVASEVGTSASRYNTHNSTPSVMPAQQSVLPAQQSVVQAASTVSASTPEVGSTLAAMSLSSSSNQLNESSNQLNETEADADPNRSSGVSGSWAESSRVAGKASRVPATQAGRVLGFLGLGASLAFGALQESSRRLLVGIGQNTESNSSNETGGPKNPSSGAAGGAYYSSFLTESNAERLAAALCRMRGAALKLGQMLSIQDESLIPPQILAALNRVRQGADVMPSSQLKAVLVKELGPNWQSLFASFDVDPMAAASIGQVHKARTHSGEDVAVKVQYPGVADSITSDLDNLALLLSYTSILPQQLYLDQAMQVAKVELVQECDYAQELQSQIRFSEMLTEYQSQQTAQLLSPASHNDSLPSEIRVRVPKVYPELSSSRLLTTEFVQGVPIDRVAELGQAERDAVARKIFEMTLLELFHFRFMQTDPNWGNFLYDPTTRTLNLIDFGAARGYPKHFVDSYIKMVRACADRDREGVLKQSQVLGFLTGEESKVMQDAHVEASFAVGLPFSQPGGFDFATNDITRRVTRLGSTLVQHRLTAPPEEAYSLHRKLSGCFLACIKLRAKVPCREVFLQVYDQYDFEAPEVEAQTFGKPEHSQEVSLAL